MKRFLEVLYFSEREKAYFCLLFSPERPEGKTVCVDADILHVLAGVKDVNPGSFGSLQGLKVRLRVTRR